MPWGPWWQDKAGGFSEGWFSTGKAKKRRQRSAEVSEKRVLSFEVLAGFDQE
jgi:hypothetical protein